MFQFLKKSDKDQVENYWPVSLLSVCAKVMERIVFNVIFPVIWDTSNMGLLRSLYDFSTFNGFARTESVVFWTVLGKLI